MRKIIVAILVFSFSSIFIDSLLFASEDRQEIQIERTGTTDGKRTRGIVELPEVWVETEGLLSVQFTSSNETYAIAIVNWLGVTVFQNNFVADGSINDYFLPDLSSGTYTIYVYNSSKSFVGTFVL